MPKAGNKYYLWTLGCQMNQSDAERIEALFADSGWRRTDNEDSADVIIIVACSIRKSAVDRVAGKAHNWRKRRSQGKLKIILTGCVLDQDRKKMAPLFDAILPITDIAKIPKIIGLPTAQKSHKNCQCLPTTPSTKFSALVPIMNGCNNFCSYCVVPYVRGRETCRPAKSIIAECRRLIKGGAKEITLLGQNVNSYHSGSYDFPRLLAEIDAIGGDFWLRFSTSHPKDLSDRLIRTMATGRHIAPHLHVALQSGDGEILKAMNRRYSPEDYLKLIGKVRRAMPEISISTDIIVGFPGETRRQFANTARLMRLVGFDMAYLSQYSPCAGTVAAGMKDNVSKVEKDRRERELNNILIKTAMANNRKYLGQEVDVLADGYKDGLCYGRTASAKITAFAGHKSLVGRKFRVKIREIGAWKLKGELISG